jgi:hypothetical protein
MSRHDKRGAAIGLRPPQLHNDRDQLQGARSRTAEPLPHQTRSDPSHHSAPLEGEVDVLQFEMRVVLAETVAPYSQALVHRMVHGDTVNRLVHDLPVPGAIAFDLLRQGNTDIPGGTQGTGRTLSVLSRRAPCLMRRM